MSRCSRALILAAVSLTWGGLTANAETLRCQSVNGNINCVGSQGLSCQTVNGQKVCMSGHGDIVQTFGNSHVDDGEMSRPPSIGAKKHQSNPWLDDTVPDSDPDGNE
jgi:hypothetical protein